MQGELFEDGWTPIRVDEKRSESYEDFVAKFNKDAPKTTDDCYTPQEVYDAVLNWLGERVDISQRPIVRPFYPGGDYVNEKYPAYCVVVDNPPFSILSKIVRFYVAHKIGFFLFAPSLTLFATAFGSDICYIVANASVVYHNKANVNTGFVTNLFPGYRVLVSPTLRTAIEKENYTAPKAASIKVKLPENVITAARLTKYTRGGDLIIHAEEVSPVKKVGVEKYNLFGSGFIVSDAAANRLKSNTPKVADDSLQIQLTKKERMIVELLNNANK